MRYLTVLFITAALAGIASAQISVEVSSFDTPATSGDAFGDIPADTYVTNDLVATCASDWLSAVLIVTPTGGGIYNHGLGAANPQSPMAALLPMYPALQYDTYVSNGVIGETVSTAAAVDYGYSSVVFDGASIAIAYYTTDTDDLGVLNLARVTLENTCQGLWTLAATASPAGGPKVLWEDGVISEGRLFIPEPATLGLLAIGEIGMLIRRKR